MNSSYSRWQVSRTHSPKTRFLGLFATFLILLVLWVRANHNERLSVIAAENIPEIRAEAENHKAPTQLAQLNLALNLQERGLEPVSSANLFGGKSWQPPLPPKESLPAAPQPAAPVVPPFDYVYLGKMIVENEDTLVFLGRGEQYFSIKKGEVLEGQFRVEEITVNSMDIMHIPTHTRMSKTFDQLAGKASSGGALSNYQPSMDTLPNYLDQSANLPTPFPDNTFNPISPQEPQLPADIPQGFRPPEFVLPTGEIVPSPSPIPSPLPLPR